MGTGHRIHVGPSLPNRKSKHEAASKEKRMELHLHRLMPGAKAEEVRSALKGINAEVCQDIEHLLSEGKTKEAEEMLLQYVTFEDHTRMIRAASRRKWRLFRLDNRHINSIFFALSLGVVFVILFFLVPWLLTGQI